MRIHYLSGAELPSARANSVHVMKMCNAFAAAGHDVTLFAYRREPNVDVHAYYDVPPRFAIRGLPRLRIPGARRLGRALHAGWHSRRAPRPDVYYGRDLYGMLAAAGTGAPMIFEAHTPPQNRAQQYLVGRLLAAGNVRRLVVISASLAERFMALYPWFPRDRVLVAHDGADAVERRRGDTIVWPGRADAPQVGYVGSLLPGKGAEIVVALAAKLPRLDFHVLGGTPEEGRRARAGYEGRNLFMHGHVAHHLVADYLERLDIALLPAQRRVVVTSGADIGEWMSPLKLFEYMAAGRAIVASSLPVIREVLSHDVNALLVAPDDIDGWAAALDLLAGDAALRRRLGSRARRDLHGAYTWARRCERVLSGLAVGG